MVLPVPGGPKSRRLLTEFENMRVCRREAKMLGKLRGRVTQSCNDCFAWGRLLGTKISGGHLVVPNHCLPGDLGARGDNILGQPGNKLPCVENGYMV